MSISPVSTLFTALSSSQGSQNNPRQEFAALANSLQSGNLAGAQQAYAALEQLQSKQSGPSPSSSNSSPVAQDFEALGKALSSGDLSEAQSAFSQLKTDMKAQQTSQTGTQGTKTHGHHHHHHSGDSDATTSTSTTTSDTTSSSVTNTVTPGSVNLLG